jgi:hypothetical protein
MHRPTHTRAVNTTYVKFPPSTLLFREKAKSDAAAAGATVRWIETIVWARPFVAPRDRLLGAEEDTYMKTEPNKSFANESVPCTVWLIRELTETHVGDGY